MAHRRSSIVDRPSSGAPGPATANTATYVYCLVQSSRTPSLRGVPDSVPGAGTPRLLSFDRGTYAVVADAPLDRFSSDALQKDLEDVESISRHALAHASVVEFFFRSAPVIPLKLFTLFSSDEAARRGVDQSPHQRVADKTGAPDDEYSGIGKWSCRGHDDCPARR